MTTNTKTLLTIKTEKTLKQAAQEVAGELGFSLGTLVNALLKQFVRNREVNISAEYRPTPELIASIREVEEELAKGLLPKAVPLEQLIKELNS